MIAQHLLSVAIFLPIVGGVAVLATGSDRNADYARQLSLVIAVLTFLVTLPLYTGFHAGSYAMQFVENYPWIDAFHVRYRFTPAGAAEPVTKSEMASCLRVELPEVGARVRVRYDPKSPQRARMLRDAR